MDKNNLYVLIHSPLVGPLTWKLVAGQMQQHGLEIIIPSLVDAQAVTDLILASVKEISP